MVAPLELLDDARSFARDAPWTDSDTDGAACMLVEEWQTPVEVHVPFQFATDHCFFSQYRIRRTGICADLAPAAEIIDVVGLFL